MKILLLIAIIVVLFSLEASAVSLSSSGEVHSVIQGNLEFRTDGSGVVKLFKNGDYLAQFGFTLKGTVNSQQKFLNSWSTSWTWEVLSNTDSNVTVLGSTNWQGLEWKQRWFFSDTEQKFANYLTNNTGFDITNTSFYYVVRFDPTNVSCLQYVDNDGMEKQYCFEQDKTITQNLGQYLKRISFMGTVFNFQDLVDAGFEFNYLFAGQLGNVKSSLAGQGFIIGVTKNDGLFPNGASIELDPSVVDSSSLRKNNFGNTLVRDSNDNIFLVHEETVTSSTTDIFVSKSLDDGNTWSTINITNSSDFNETFPSIDINSTDGLVIIYDKYFVGTDQRQTFLTTCSAGGCDEASNFLADINISQCGIGTTCGNNYLVIDQNDFSHMIYANTNNCELIYRRNTTYAGEFSNWGAEEVTLDAGGSNCFLFSNTSGAPDGTGVLVSKNGSNLKLAFASANGGGMEVSYFDGSVWNGILSLDSGSVNTPPAGFGGYDGNFYLAYTKNNGGGQGGTPKQVHFRQCDIDTNCSAIGNWSADVNVTLAPLNFEYLSLVQNSDLNVFIITSQLPTAADSNVFLYTRTPNGIFTTSHIADGNLLFSDTNRTYNPLLSNKTYPGGFRDVASFPPATHRILYTFLTSNNSTGDPSTLLFDSNIVVGVNGITSTFTITPVSPFVLTPTVSNIAVDFNSTTEFVGTIVDINFLWQIDGEELNTDQNIVRDFNGVDEDFNMSLIVQGNDGVDTFTSQSDQNVNIINVLQSFDINFALNVFNNNADLNIGGLFGGGTSLINFIVWGGTDIDINRTGLQFTIDYNAGGIKQVCGVFNTSGDVNTVYCESFNITEALVKIPLDEEVPATTLSPFIIAVDGTAPQNYSGQSADLNVFMFDQNTNQYVNINVDFNASYFPRNYGIFTGQPNNLFFTIQPHLALVANSIQVNWITQDVLANSSLSNINIKSERSIASILTEVESPFTDITGSATLTFIPQITYTLTFDLNGVTIGTGIYIPASSDTLKKAFLNVEDINVGTFIQSALDVNFTPAGGVLVLPSDFNATTISQDINVFDGNLQSLRILVTHGSATLSDTNETAAGTFTQTLALSGRDLNTLLIVQVTAVISGESFLVQKVYGLRATPGLEDRFTTAKNQDIGHTGATLLSVILTAVAIGGLIGLNRAETQDNSSLSFLAIPILMFFAFLNWVSWVPIIFGSAAAIILYFSNRASKGGFA